MKKIQFVCLLLLLCLTFTGCIQISFPQSQKGTEKAEETVEGGTRPRPTDTEQITEEPKPVLDERGSVSSTESDSVVLRADWKAISYDGKTAEVTVNVYISYSKLSKGKSTGSVTVNGQTKNFSVKAIEKQTSSKATINPANFTFTVGLNKSGTTKLELETVWELNTKVNGSYVESLNATAEFPLWNESKDTTDETDDEVPGTGEGETGTGEETTTAAVPAQGGTTAAPAPKATPTSDRETTSAAELLE